MKEIENNLPARLGNIYNSEYGGTYAGNVWSRNAISPAILTMSGGNRQPMVVEKVNDEKS